MRSRKIVAAIFLFVSAFTACKKDVQPTQELAQPKIENVEIGLNNNEIGIIGRDFHFNADIIAGDKIDVVQIKIIQRSAETYASSWNHEITWEQYKGAKNTNVHKHFSIPDNAVEGKYDFVITVKDENGTTLEEKRRISIYSAANLPSDPKFNMIGVDIVDGDYNFIRALISNDFIGGSNYLAEEGIKKGEFFAPSIMIDGVKGDGKMYCLLISKKHNHKPESIKAIDFSKVIVANAWEHKGLTAATTISNLYNYSTTPMSFVFPSLKVGAISDNNIPSNPISGVKTWETGSYYFGVIYQNSTYNMSLFKYIDIKININ